MSRPAPEGGLLPEASRAPVLLVEGGNVVAASSAANELFGRDAVGSPLGSLLDPGSRAKLSAAQAAGTLELQVLREDRPPIAVRFQIERFGPRIVLVACAAGPAYSELAEHRLLEANARLANLTRELSQQHAELAAAKAELERLGTLRDAAMAALSHDIRSPLTAIGFLAASLEQRTAPLSQEDGARTARRIRRNADRILRLADQILDTARLDAGAVVVDGEPVSLVALAREVADSVEPIAAASGVRIELTFTAAEGWVAGDGGRLSQVLANLVGNAIRYSPPRGTVRITVEPHGDRVRCAVRDEGPGVPEELRAHVFQRFRQGGSNAGSAGLGLYIARRIVELHAGRIWLEEPGPRGAGFAFEIASAPPPEPEPPPAPPGFSGPRGPR